MSAVSELDGIQKAAILLITLGPEKAAGIFKHLKEDEIEQLTLEIANTRSVSPADKEAVLNEFYEVCLAQQYIAEGGIGYATDLLQKALGEDKAKEVLGKLTASLQVRPFEFIRKTGGISTFELYSGRASTDYCDDLVLSVADTVCNDLGCIDTGKTGGCCKENRNDGSYISGCYQRGGACVRTKAVILIKSGLHNRRWRRCDRRYFEYGRPRNRKAYHGISRNRAA